MPSELLNLNVDLERGFDRRVFIKGLGFVSMGLLLSTLGGCEACVDQIKNRPTRRRLRTGSAEVDAAIATYKNAVTLMKGLPAGDPRSWNNQAGLHGTVAGGFNFCQHGTDHFFSWHRAYLLYFEWICQELTGDKTFGLPYWNWNQDPAMHSAFTDPGSPLSHPRVNTTVAGNSAFSNATLNTIFSDTNFFTFSSQVEGTPHNMVHNVVGDDMVTGGSPQDPVFWAHHCMVDYCWAKWNIELGNNNTNDSGWINTSWNHFVDGKGNPLTVTAGATTIMPLLSYQYESSAIGGFAAAAKIAAKDFKKLETRLKQGADMRFDVKSRVRIAERARLSLAQPLSMETRMKPGDFSALVESDSARERVFASVDWAQLPPANDFFVRVFVNLPGANIHTSTDDPHFAGSFAFFGTDGEHGGHHGKTDFLVNVTETLKRVGRGGQSGDGISIQLVAVPVTNAFARPDTELVLEKIDLIVSPVLVRSE
jgi:tyrosinase